MECTVTTGEVFEESTMVCVDLTITEERVGGPVASHEELNNDEEEEPLGGVSGTTGLGVELMEE